MEACVPNPLWDDWLIHVRPIFGDDAWPVADLTTIVESRFPGGRAQSRILQAGPTARRKKTMDIMMFMGS